MTHEQQWFPGLEPRKPYAIPRPGKITVTTADPITIEEKESMKDDTRDTAHRESMETVKAAQDIFPQASPEPVRAPAPESSKTPEAQDERPNNIPAAPIRGKRFNVYFVRVSSSLLAALSALMSWYYSFEWFREKLPGAWRFFLPIIIVGCSVMLPQVALIFLNKRGAKYKGTALAVCLVGLLASAFSMLSTIAGIYNANSDAINRKSVAIVSAQSDIDARAELKRIDAELERLNKEIDSTQIKVDSISVSDTLQGDSQALMRRLNNAKRSKQDYEAQRKTANVAIESARATGNTRGTVREDFNAFLGRQFETDPGRVEFIMAASPALLLDIVAPILSAVALFL